MPPTSRISGRTAQKSLRQATPTNAGPFGGSSARWLKAYASALGSWSRQHMGTGLPLVVVVKQANVRPWTPHDPPVFSDPHEQVTGDVAADAREHQEGASPPSERSTVKAHCQRDQPDEAQASDDHHNRARTVAILHLLE